MIYGAFSRHACWGHRVQKRPTVNREHYFRSKLYSVDKCDFKEDDFEPPGSDLMKKI